LGHDVEEAHPEALDDPATILHYVRVVGANVAQAVEAWGRRLGRKLGPDDVELLTWALAERSREMTAPELLDCIDEVHAFGRRLAAWWEGGWDLLVTPTTAQPSPEIGWLTSTADDPLRAFLRSAPYGAFTSPFNLSGQPAISLPLHSTADGLPVGAQIAAAWGREDLLLSVASSLEEAAPWSDRRPPVFG
ncbi:MAG: amidase family protein, partial [Alphaproteobacteria bacterium]